MLATSQKAGAGLRALPCLPSVQLGRRRFSVGTVQHAASRRCAAAPFYESVSTADDACPGQQVAEQGAQGPIEADATSQQPTELWWRWKWGSRIRYYRAGHAGLPPLVLVHGFGVGCWHFEHNMEELSKNYQVFAVELLGQGSSWPAVLSSASSMSISGSVDDQDDDVTAHGPLHFSVATWTQQLTDFVAQVVGGPAYVAGNSLGGFLAVSLAFHHPELVRGLVLLNSTPFWSMRPSLDQPQGLWGWLGFDGTVPAPTGLKRAIELIWWNQLRNRHTIKEMLALVYAHKQAARSDALVDRIVAATEQPGALDAFASIMMSPKSSHDFDAMLRELRCPVCLVYGKQDPWVVPMWGQRAAYNLLQADKPLAMYLELNEAGHCPHHEAPAACNMAMHMCLTFMDQLQACQTQPNPLHTQQQGTCPPPPLAVGQQLAVTEECGRQVTIEHVDGRPRHVGEYIGWLSCVISDRFRKGRAQAATTAAAGTAGGTQAAAAENQQ